MGKEVISYRKANIMIKLLASKVPKAILRNTLALQLRIFDLLSLGRKRMQLKLSFSREKGV